MLVVEHLTKRYGGLVALNDVTFTAERGEVTGLIGPNGAGKTTLLNIVSGYTRSDEGTVRVDGRSVGSARPARRFRLGLSRTFQDGRAFGSRTLAENFRTGSRLVLGAGGAASLASGRISDFLAERTDASTPMRDVPHGARMLVGLGLAVLAVPKVLLLDEPVAGLDTDERALALSVITDLAAEGTAVVMIEHNVDVVLDTCAQVVVLDFGRVIASAPAGEIVDDPVVIESYLGASLE